MVILVYIYIINGIIKKDNLNNFLKVKLKKIIENRRIFEEWIKHEKNKRKIPSFFLSFLKYTESA